MKRMQTSLKEHWEKYWDNVGFTHHSFRNPYWMESLCYVFTEKEVSVLEQQMRELYALGHSEAKNHLAYLAQAGVFKESDMPWIAGSLGQAPLLERLDIAWDGVQAKLLDWNTQCPSGLFEASFVQWEWSERYFPKADQFNTIHVALMKAINARKDSWPKDGDAGGILDPDQTTSVVRTWGLLDNPITDADQAYFRDLCLQSDIAVKTFNEDGAYAVDGHVHDADGLPVKTLMSFAPLEGILDSNWTAANIHWVNPAWLLALEHNHFLKWLHDKHPTHPAILGAYDTQKENTIPKNAWSYFSAGVGDDSEHPVVHQEMANIEPFQRFYPVVRCWFVDGQFCGISVVEDKTMIHKAASFQSVPHIINE